MVGWRRRRINYKLLRRETTFSSTSARRATAAYIIIPATRLNNDASGVIDNGKTRNNIIILLHARCVYNPRVPYIYMYTNRYSRRMSERKLTTPTTTAVAAVKIPPLCCTTPYPIEPNH